MSDCLEQRVFIVSWVHRAFLPPVNSLWDSPDIRIHESAVATWCPSEHPVMTNLGASKGILELMVRQISKLVQLKLASGHSVLPPPPLIQRPEALLSLELLLMEIETRNHSQGQSQGQKSYKKLATPLHSA